MKRFLFSFFFALSACNVITVDISHVETKRGYLNSSSDDLGQLYLFALDGSLFEPLGVIPAAKGTAKGTVWEKVQAKELDGYVIKGELDKAIEGRVHAEIAKDSSIELQNMQNETLVESITILSSYINGNKEKLNLDEIWKLKEAAQDDSQLRLAIVHTTVNADQAAVRHAGATKTGGGFKIPFSWRGEAEIEISGFSEEAFVGDQVPALTRFYIFKVGYGDGGKYSFDVRGQTEKDTFIDILRN